MIRGALGAVGWLAVCVLACARAAPVTVAKPTAPPEDAAQYYPLSAGWRWAYDIEKGSDQILAIYAVVQRDGAIATLQAGEDKLVYGVLPDGIVRGEPVADPARADFLLKTPIRMGAQWPILGGTATVTAVAKTVSVPAGEYTNCVVVEENRTTPARLVRTTYAPGTGPITIEMLIHDELSGVFRPALRARLRGVTAPGTDPVGGNP
jgi:hypothetical protein